MAKSKVQQNHRRNKHLFLMEYEIIGSSESHQWVYTQYESVICQFSAEPGRMLVRIPS